MGRLITILPMSELMPQVILNFHAGVEVSRVYIPENKLIKTRCTKKSRVWSLDWKFVVGIDESWIHIEWSLNVHMLSIVRYCWTSCIFSYWTLFVMVIHVHYSFATSSETKGGNRILQTGFTKSNRHATTHAVQHEEHTDYKYSK